MEFSFPSKKYRITASEFLAMVVHDLFPQVTLLGGGITQEGFYYDFKNLPALDESFFPYIEQKMHEWKNKELKIEEKEMMKENASDFLRHKKLETRAEKTLQTNKNVVSLFSCGNFFDLQEGPFLSNTKEIGKIKILEIQALKDPDTFEKFSRIFGVGFLEIDSLKHFLKLWKKVKKEDPIELAFRKDLLIKTQNFLIWTPVWEEWKQFFLRIWQDLHPFPYYQTYVPYRFCDFFEKEKFEKIKSKNKLIRLKEWKKEEDRESDEVLVICGKENIRKELISSLHFIDKTINIFGMEYRWTLFPFGPSNVKKVRLQKVRDFLISSFNEANISFNEEEEEEISFYFEEENEAQGKGKDALRPKESIGYKACVFLYDGLKRKRPVSFVKLIDQTKSELSEEWLVDELDIDEIWMIQRSLYGIVDRFMLLLIEHYKDKFPFWLAPEQIRFLAKEDHEVNFARETISFLAKKKVRCGFDFRSLALEEKIRHARRAQIPWIGIVEKEQSKGYKISFQKESERGFEQKRNFLEPIEWHEQIVKETLDSMISFDSNL